MLPTTKVIYLLFTVLLQEINFKTWDTKCDIFAKINFLVLLTTGQIRCRGAQPPHQKLVLSPRVLVKK